MNISENSIIGELVAENYRTAPVFKAHGIDFCCNGNRTIAAACEKKRIEPGTLIKELESAAPATDDAVPAFNNWPADLLADYIEKKHHRYVEKQTRELPPFLNKVVQVHGDRHPELQKVQALFYECMDHLLAHMRKEEKILFPYIRQMVVSGKLAGKPVFGSVENPISMMVHEHEQEGDRFREIASLTNGYTPPEDACNTYRVCYSMLKEFEEDLHLHIHLENNILFPKAIELEAKIIS